MYKKGKGGCISRQRERRGGRVLEDTYMPSIQRRARYTLDREEGSSSACIGPRTERYSFLQLSLSLSAQTHARTPPQFLPLTHTHTHAHRNNCFRVYQSALAVLSFVVFAIGWSQRQHGVRLYHRVAECVCGVWKAVCEGCHWLYPGKSAPSFLSLSFSFCSF